MATTKTVNITSGKVLNYTIKAEGYKTVSASKLIKEDTIINVNMIPTTSPDGVYTFGDRIGGIATFVGYFDSTDPNTQENKKLAFFVLDAKYRTSGKNIETWWNAYYNWGLPQYSNSTLALNAKESATYNTQYLFDNFTVNTNTFKPLYYARNAATIEVDGKYYSSQLPNIYELQQIYINRVNLDTFDPTLENYPTNNLSDWNMSYSTYEYNTGCHSSTENSDSGVWVIRRDGSVTITSKSTSSEYRLGIIPIFEIPVN